MNQIPRLHVFKDDIDLYPKKLWDYKMLGNNLYYIDHHQSHAAYAYLLSKYNQSDILAIDGRGWKYNCIFIDKENNITELDYKDVRLLKKFVNDQGKIMPRRVTGTSAKMHRKVVGAIKRARTIGLMPFVDSGSE